MRIRTIVFLLLLIVLPTAVLSIMASRALKVKESQLSNQMESSADSALEAVKFKADKALGDILADIRDRIAAEALDTSKYLELLESIVMIQEDYPFVSHLVLVSPEGAFQHPPSFYQQNSWSVGARTGGNSPPGYQSPADLAVARRMQHEMKDYASAATLFEKVLASENVLLSDRCEAGFGLSSCHVAMGNKKDSLQVLDEIIILVQGQGGGVERLGNVRDEEGYDYSLAAQQRKVELYSAFGNKGLALSSHLALLTAYIEKLPFLSDLQVLGIEGHLEDYQRELIDLSSQRYAPLKERRRFLLKVLKEQRFSLSGSVIHQTAFQSLLTSESLNTPYSGFAFEYKQQLFVFSQLSGGAKVGIVVQTDALADFIQSLIRTTPSPDAIMIDLASIGTTYNGMGGPHESRLSSTSLSSPFSAVQLNASAVDLESLAAGARQEIRLYSWGIFLLAFGIILGTGLVIGQASSAVKEARAKSDYVAGVSHDLRTPLASMKLMTESLYHGHVKDEDKQRQFLGTVLQEAARLELLVERVLFFVRFGQDAITYNIQSHELNAWLTESVGKFKRQYKDDISVVLKLADQPIRVHMDRESMTQVLQNLFDNAVKYAGADKPITIESRIDGRLAVVSVSDEGPGIAPAHARKIFSRYYRAETEKEKNLSGVGLGLAMASDIMKKHGGKIELNDGADVGARFSLSLPVDHD